MFFSEEKVTAKVVDGRRFASALSPRSGKVNSKKYDHEGTPFFVRFYR